MNTLLYIGPGLGLGSLILIFIIGGLVLFSFAYIIWLKFKKRFKNKK
jgi:hypothetical protein